MKNRPTGHGCRRRAKTAQNNRGAYLPGLRSCRMMAALTQRELAERIGSSPGTISDLENARRAAFPRTIRRLSRALDVEPAELIRIDH
jgi:DNA-binding XRE family transcriptional regulator